MIMDDTQKAKKANIKIRIRKREEYPVGSE